MGENLKSGGEGGEDRRDETLEPLLSKLAAYQALDIPPQGRGGGGRGCTRGRSYKREGTKLISDK
jgi:hypothetical protein